MSAPTAFSLPASFFPCRFPGLSWTGNSNNEILDSCVINNQGTGIDFGDATTQNIIEDTNIVNNNGSGIDLKGSSYINISRCNISNNNGTNGIYSSYAVHHINIVESLICNNTGIIGNISGSGGDGINLHNPTHIRIIDSKISGNSNNGIYF